MNKFFYFMQNNSGGDFHFDEHRGITCNVVIEAGSPESANELALTKGLYFDGCADGLDCPCCGDRWYAVRHDDVGDDAPSVYGNALGRKIESSFIFKWMPDGRETAVHYLDGRIEWFNADGTPATGSAA